MISPVYKGRMLPSIDNRNKPMSMQIKKTYGARFIAGGALVITGGLLLLLGDWLFANTMTNWAYAQITWPIILTGVGALMIFRAIGNRDESARRGETARREVPAYRGESPANQGHYAT